MENFTYYNPVKIVFGRGMIAELPKLVPPGARIMIIYGGGSIKRNSVYDQIIEALKGWELHEFSGIEPNPLYETCMKAVSAVRENNIDFLLAAGGGSVADAAKFIAAAAKYRGDDPWELVLDGGETIVDAIPLGCIMTLPATGSEMNTNSVISRASTHEKYPFSSLFVYPQFSILDPETTYSLPERQTVNGIVDTFVHVMEQYMTYDLNAPLQDRKAEAIIQVLIEEAPKVKADPRDYDARANLMWCATMGLNGLISCGQIEDWSTHMIGHELTAIYGIDHAESLAVVLPALWRKMKNDKAAKLLKFGRRVFNIDSTDKEKAIDETIDGTVEFFRRLGMKTTLSEYGIDAAEAAEKIRVRFKERGTVLGENRNIDADVAAQIILDCR